MIPVVLADEPEEFDGAVRQRGLSAIDELVGRQPRLESRRGRRRLAIASREEDIPPSKFPPFWRDCLPQLHEAYHGRCAFLAQYIELATGNPTVDHMLPKSRHWNQVYEWSNYRLCAGRINAAKSNLEGLIDPFECRDGWFALEFVGYQVVVGDQAPADRLTSIRETMKLVNDWACRKERERYVMRYRQGRVSFEDLMECAPFIALELQRQELQ